MRARGRSSGVSREDASARSLGHASSNHNGGDEGTIIQAVGAPFFGYSLEIKHDYDLALTKKFHLKILLGHVDEAKLVRLAEVAKSVQAPGISKNPLDPFGVGYADHLLYLVFKY